MSKKDKLLQKLLAKQSSFTWAEAETLMKQSGFRLLNKSGSARMFYHEQKKIKVRLHEPHPQNTLLKYMVDELIEGLRTAGELSDE